MASVSWDSELMTNYVATTPMAAGSHFVTVLDEHRRPMVFCLSNDTTPKLHLLRRDASGQSLLLELNEIFQLPKDANIQTFHVVQSWSLMLYMVIAWRVPPSTDVSHAVVLRPFAPDSLHTAQARLPAYGGDHKLGRVEKIFMSPVGDSDDDYFPDVYLNHKAFNQSTSWGSDITNIRVDTENGTWTPTFQMSTPKNVSGILDVAPAVSVYGKGLYVLYNDSNATSQIYVRFIRPDPTSSDGNLITMVKELQCPPDATAIVSFLTPESRSSLLTAASDGIRLLTPAQAVSSNTTGTLIYPDLPDVRALREMKVSQDQDAVTLWFRTTKRELGYIRTTSDAFDQGISTLLRPEDSTAAFSACTAAPTRATGNVTRQMLISEDTGGDLTLLEQSSDLGAWKTTPFFKPSSTESTEVRSYTVTVRATLANHQPARNARVFMSASSTISVLINGTNVLLAKQAAWFDCDSQGSLDFIIPTNTLASPILRVEKLRGGDGKALPIQRTSYDPALKVINNMISKLEKVNSAEAFRDLRTDAGEKVIPDSAEHSIRFLDTARSGLIEIGKAYSHFTNLNTASENTAAMAMDDLLSENSAEMVMDNQLSEPEADSIMPAGSKTFWEKLMDAFWYFWNNIRNARDWIIQKAGATWKFVVTIGERTKEFVLDCVEKVAEVAGWIWSKLEVAWNSICDFVGFVFNWNDILATKDTISSLLTHGMTYASSRVKGATKTVDEYCDSLIKNIDAWGEMAPDKPLSTNDDGVDQKVKDAQKSTPCNWASERLKNGGAGKSAKLRGEAGESSEAQNIWDKDIVPAMNEIATQLQKVGKDVLDLFLKGTISAALVIGVSKSAIKTGINTVRTIINKVLDLAAGLVIKLRDVGNTAIDIPVFTWLYKKISGGHDLTLFDAFSLVIAVPTTVFAKIVTGECPPKLPNLDAVVLEKLMRNDKSVDKQLKADFDVLKIEITIGITLTTAVIGVLKLMYKAATGGHDAIMDKMKQKGPSGVFDVFGIAVDIVNTLVALPDSADLPGAEYRNWIAYVSCARGVYHSIFFFVKGGATADMAALCLDLLTVLANLGLSVAVFMEEKKAGAKWKDYDQTTCEMTMITNGLNAVSGIAYFTAFAFKTTQPQVAAIGAAAMVGTVAGAAVLQGAVFRQQIDTKKTPRLVQGSPF